MPLVEIVDGRHIERGEIAVPGPSVVATGASLHIEGPTRDAIVDGAWSNIDEFELVTCLETEFEQASFVGEDGPRANDCGAIPVVVVREAVGPDGLPLPSEDPGAAKTREAEVYGDSWGANAGYGFGYSGLSFEAWLDVNSSTGPSSTYGGIPVHSAGAWYEAGVNSTATVFGYDVTLVDIYGTFIGYEFGGGGVAMHAQLFNDEFIPEFEIQLSDGEPLTLQEMFDASGVDADPSLVLSVPILGKTFDDGCDDVGAQIAIEASVGVDTEQTSVMVSTTGQGIDVTGVFAPYFDFGVVAEAHTGTFLGVSLGIVTQLTLLNISLPFEVTVEVIEYEALDALRLNFYEDASAWFTTLSGSIDFEFEYDAFWGNETHSHNIAHWDGLSAGVHFFRFGQVLNVGADAPGDWCTDHGHLKMFSGDFDSDGVEDYLCHRGSDGQKWIDFGGSYGATDLSVDFTGCRDAGQTLVFGDFNGDGRDDLLCHMVVFTALHGTHYWGTLIDYADANGQFSGFQSSAVTNWCVGDNKLLRTGDYNSDGRDDLLCYRRSDGYTWIDYANGNGKMGGTDWEGYGLPDLMMQEETSYDSELNHGDETVHYLGITPTVEGSPLHFAQDVGLGGIDPASLRWK